MKRLSAYLLLSLLVVSLAACSSRTETPSSSSSPTYLTDFQLRADAGNGKVTLEWLMYPAAVSYNIYVGTSSSSLTKITTVPASVISAPYTVTGLTNNTKYYFSVSGVNSLGVESDLAIPIFATPVDPYPPAAPENVRANAGDVNITVTWTPVADADYYNIYCSWQTSLTDMGEAVSTVNDQASNSIVINESSITWIYNTDTADPGIVNNRSYTCWVTAVNDNGTADTSDDLESSPSFDYVATPNPNPPPFAPVLTTANTGSSSSQQVILAWNAPVSSTGTVTYTVYYGTAKGVTNNTGVQADVGDATAVSVNNLTSGVKYYFVVTATDDNGESAISNEKYAVAY